MSDPGLERTQLILPGVAGGGPRALISPRANATNLPDSRDQSLTLGHGSPPAGSLGPGAAGRVAAAFLVGHRTDHQGAALDLLADQRELLRPFLLSALSCRLHTVTRHGIERCPPASRPRSRVCIRPGGVPRAPDSGGSDIDLLPLPAPSGGRREIRCVGEENLTSGNTTRTATVAPSHPCANSLHKGARR